MNCKYNKIILNVNSFIQIFYTFFYIFYMELINNKLELALSRLNIRQEDLIRNLQKKTPVIIEIAGVTC